MTFIFRHPKYYKGLKKVYESEKVICERCKAKVTVKYKVNILTGLTKSS